MQNFTDIQATDNISASLAPLEDNMRTILSCSSGTAFPTTELQVGMLCYRTDQEKLHELRSTGPAVWVEIADLSQTYLSKEDADGFYSAAAHTHNWADINGKPTTFAPSAHNHAVSDLTDAGTAASKDTGTSGNNVPLLDGANTWSGAQRGALVALSAVSNDVTPDFALANNFTLTMGGLWTLKLPSNIVAGQAGSIFVEQDGTGNRTLAYDAQYKFVDGEAPVLSTAANAKDRLDYIVRSATEIHISASLNVS